MQTTSRRPNDHTNLIVIFAQHNSNLCVNFIRHAWRFCVNLFWRKSAIVGVWRIDSDMHAAWRGRNAARSRNASALRLRRTRMRDLAVMGAKAGALLKTRNE